jgi:hypothetical protein
MNRQISEMNAEELGQLFPVILSDRKSEEMKFIDSQERQEFIFSLITEHQQKLIDFTGIFGNKNWRKEIVVKRV